MWPISSPNVRTSLVGRYMYLSGGTACAAVVIQPLTSSNPCRSKVALSGGLPPWAVIVCSVKPASSRQTVNAVTRFMTDLLAGFSPLAPRADNGEYPDGRPDDAKESDGRLGLPRGRDD